MEVGPIHQSYHANARVGLSGIAIWIADCALSQLREHMGVVLCKHRELQEQEGLTDRGFVASLILHETGLESTWSCGKFA